jgi:thiol-disulfide isomerase/thioredoxin
VKIGDGGFDATSGDTESPLLQPFKRVLPRGASFLLVVLLAIIVSGCTSMSPQVYDLVGKRAPTARLMLLDGEEIPVSALEGKHVGLIFWATWCGHSKARIEDFEELAKRYSRRKNVVFLAVSIDRAEAMDNLRSRIESQGLQSVTHVFSGNDVQDEAFQAFRGEAVPYVVTIDPRGRVRSVDTSTSSLEEYLESVFVEEAR